MIRLFLKLMPLYLFLFSISIGKSANYEDSLSVQLSEIKFTDSLEMETFKKVLYGEDQYLKLFYASCNPDYNETHFSDLENSIDDLEAYLTNKNLPSKSEKKKIKLIHGEVHDRYLRKYEEMVNFYKLNESGIYNCVTASGLYAVILDRFNIPYSIKESPQHVFILAYPDSHKILLESTDPLKGYKAYKEDYKSMFVQSLWKNKLISDSEYKSGSTDELFEKYFFPEEDLKLKELLAIHYLNNAIELAGKEIYQDAFEQIKKAYLLYPSEKTFLLLFEMNLTLLENVSYKNDTDLENLIFLTKFIGKGISSNDITNEFARITYEYLVEKYNPESYIEIYDKLLLGIKDEKLKQEIDYIYNYERGRVCLTKGRYEESMGYTEKAFCLHPENSDAQINFIHSIAQVQAIKGFRQADLEKIEKTSSDYPAILENNNFIRLLGFYYAGGAEQAFKDDNPALGDGLISKLEILINDYPNVAPDENVIGRAYSEAAVYYFKKGKTNQAKSLIRKGLTLAPDSQELNVRKMMLQY